MARTASSVLRNIAQNEALARNKLREFLYRTAPKVGDTAEIEIIARATLTSCDTHDLWDEVKKAGRELARLVQGRFEMTESSTILSGSGLPRAYASAKFIFTQLPIILLGAALLGGTILETSTTS